MTPDELRRMDNNECIIFEKGIKPIKAKKYWWFDKSSVSRDLNSRRIDHNDFDPGNRGEWRKYNPYATNQQQEEKEQTFAVQSLDDLFIEEDKKAPENNTKVENKAKSEAPIQPIMKENNIQSDKATNNIEIEQRIEQINPVTVDSQVAAPINQSSNINSIPVMQNDDEIDIQKELEAKFDELFGTIE